MQLSVGDQLGPYQVTGLIGKGGMGEVYRATDTRLKRAVAIKTSKREFSDRFEREAHAIASLNHPNICTLHDVGPDYLVMELVEGELLSKIIDRGPLPLDKALAYSIQIADALASAHAKGIVHRDLKPGNIIITANGAKVLDFGLAKLANELAPDEISKVETAASAFTTAGAVLGTLFYMAPEQAEGKEADARSDIFAFGVCLYEMVTGQHPFNGDTQAAVLASVLRDQPAPMSQRQPAVPRALERITRRCLEKKSDDRWNSARDLKAALETIDLDAAPITTASGTPISGPVPASAPNRKRWLWPAAALLLLAALGYAGWTMRNKPIPVEKATRFQVTLPEDVQFNEYVSVSPDGRRLLFTASGDKRGIWIRDLETLEWRRLTGTETSVVFGPAWSPDGKFISYSTGVELKKVALDGSPPVTLCKSPGFQIGTSAWTPDGSTLVFGGRRQGALYRVSSSGGIPEPVTAIDSDHGEAFNALPYFLPDGKHFLYLRGGNPEIQGVYLGSLDTNPKDQSRNRRIMQSTLAVPYVDGRIFFVRDGTLMAQTFDAGKLELSGEPFPIAEHIGTTNSTAMFSVSKAGVLAYRQVAGEQRPAATRSTAWYDRAGKQTSRLAIQNRDSDFRLSPDARRAVSLGRTDQGGNDGLWITDFASVRTRLTFQQPNAVEPVWSPDGIRVYYTGGDNRIYQKAADGAGEARQIVVSRQPGAFATSVSPDGKFLLYFEGNPGGIGDIWLLPLDSSDPKPISLLQTQALEIFGAFSPDGRWIAYLSNESGRFEVYVRPFLKEGPKGPSFGEGKWQVSHNGVDPVLAPRWTRNGREIVFQVGVEYHAVAVSASGNVFQPGQETTLFPLRGLSWDVTADGEKFLITSSPNANVQTSQGPQAPITVVLNWEAGFKK